MQYIPHTKHACNLSQAERWASILGGSALAVVGIQRRSPMGWAMALIGGELVRRGATGHSYLYEAVGVRTAGPGQGAETTSVPYEVAIRVDEAITVNQPREEVYRFWRNLENLPSFMKHLESVRVLDGNRSHWVAKGPAGRTVEWDAAIHNELAGELIAWRSLPGSRVDHAGSVQFRDAPGGRGTEVRVEMQYNPPGGLVGAAVAKIWGEEPSQQVREDLRRFKQIMEAGEILTTEGQPSARQARTKSDASREQRQRSEEVEYASELSFPASDAPSYTQ